MMGNKHDREVDKEGANQGQTNARFPPKVAPRNALISKGSDDVRPSPEIMVAWMVAFRSAGEKLLVVFPCMSALCTTKGLSCHWAFCAHMVPSLGLALTLSLSLSAAYYSLEAR